MFFLFLKVITHNSNRKRSFFLWFSGSLSSRIVGGILVEVVIFVVTVVLAMLDSSTWPGTFFWITMVTVVVLNSKFYMTDNILSYQF